MFLYIDFKYIISYMLFIFGGNDIKFKIVDFFCIIKYFKSYVGRENNF